MSMKYIVLSLLGLALVATTACKKRKFDHTATPTPGACELCAYADSLEGTYTGQVTGQDYPTPHDQTVTFEHIFLNFNSPIDSAIMFLRKTKTDLTTGETWIDTISIHSDSGRTFDDEGEFSGLSRYEYVTIDGYYQGFDFIVTREFNGFR